MLTLKNPIFCSADLNIPYHASAVEAIGNGVTLNTTPPPPLPPLPHAFDRSKLNCSKIQVFS